MEFDKLWTGNIGDIAHGYCIDGFLPDTALGRVIRLRQQVTGEFFLLTVLKIWNLEFVKMIIPIFKKNCMGRIM